MIGAIETRGEFKVPKDSKLRVILRLKIVDVSFVEENEIMIKIGIIGRGRREYAFYCSQSVIIKFQVVPAALAEKNVK